MKQLPDHVTAKVSLSTGTCNDKTGSRRYQQGWNLADQALANRQQGIGLQGMQSIQITLQHTDNKTANNIDKHDEDSSNRITLDELGSTIHRTKEIRFMLNLLAPDLSLRICNRTLI